MPVSNHVLEKRLGDFIARWYERSGKSRIEIAAHVGIHKHAIARVEKGVRSLSFIEGLLLFEALEIPPRLLLDLLQKLRTDNEQR